MRWLVGVLLLVSFGRALAQETPTSTEELQKQYTLDAYERVTVMFNTNIKDFASWAAFKAEVLSQVSPDTRGRCYALTGDAVQITTVRFPGMEDNGWRKTSGKGWRWNKKDRTFIEYRLNTKAGVLLRAEGVKSSFLFTITRTKKICEFPL
jgi:hypothetical protein